MLTVGELKKFLDNVDDDDTVMVDYGMGYSDTTSISVYKQYFARIGERKRNSVIINVDGGLLDAYMQEQAFLRNNR